MAISIECTRACLQLAIVATVIKLLLIPTYRSTDFEVHRNWLAITHSLPISKWYYEATSEWTLDYPPFFAWFEWLLSQAARWVDPAMLVVSNLEYASDRTVYFQRGTVIVTDLVLLAAAFGLARLVGSEASGGQPRQSAAALLFFFLVSCSAGLLLVDHVHFQYNGVMMGLLLWSLHAALTGRHLLSGLLFAALLNLKHLFLYAGPAYFIYLLRHYCLEPTTHGGAPGGSLDAAGTIAGGAASGRVGAGAGAAGGSPHTQGGAARGDDGCGGVGAAKAAAVSAPVGGRRAGPGGRHGAGPGAALAQRAAARLVVLGGGVVAIFAASFGPFVAMGQLPQVLRRLFPFGRGLMHAYWAANAWAPYAAADKLLTIALPRLAARLQWDLPAWLRQRLEEAGGRANLAGGLVGVSQFTVLPQVTPGMTAAAVLLALVPCLVALWRGDGGGGRTGFIRRTFARAVSYSFLCGFVFGYHVHEKAVLVALLPMAVDAVRSARGARRFLLLSSAGHFALLPLLFRPQEYGAKVMLVLSYFVVATMGLRSLHGHDYTDGEDGSKGFNAAERAGGGNGDVGGDSCGGGANNGGRDPLSGPLRAQAGSHLQHGSQGRVLGTVAWCYLAGFLVVELYGSVVHNAVPDLRQRLPFVPLMLTSVYCSLGVLVVWADMAAEWMLEAARGRAED